MPEIINEGPNPRFVGGRLIAVGEPYNPEEAAGSEAYVTGTTPAGQLSVEQLEALLARKKGEATPVADPVSQAAIDDRLRPFADEHVHAPAATDPAPLTAEQQAALDRDGDGAAGGSRKKAEIAADLTAAGVAFDSRLTRDELQALLDDHNKKA
jgi:hypothetical protein